MSHTYVKPTCWFCGKQHTTEAHAAQVSAVIDRFNDVKAAANAEHRDDAQPVTLSMADLIRSGKTLLRYQGKVYELTVSVIPEGKARND